MDAPDDSVGGIVSCRPVDHTTRVEPRHAVDDGEALTMPRMRKLTVMIITPP